MVASLIARLKAREDENRRLKKRVAEERLNAEIVVEALKKMVAPSYRREMAQRQHYQLERHRQVEHRQNLAHFRHDDSGRHRV